MSGAAQVFCFDLDDTLCSESDYVESGLAAAGGLVDAAVPAPERAGDWLVRLWRSERPRDGFQRLLRARGLDVEAWLPRLLGAYRAHEPALRPREGVPEVLAHLVARGGRLALLTDGPLDVQRRKWAALGLALPFDPVVFTDVRGRPFWKPHPWGFEQVMRAHPGGARFLYVGDNPAKDFLGPNRLGWTSVLVRDRRNLHPPDCREGDDAAPQVVLDSLGALASLA